MRDCCLPDRCFHCPAFSAASASVRTSVSTRAPRGTSVSRIQDFQSPAWVLKNLGSVWISSPVVATIHGVKAVVLATLSGEIYVVNAKSGRELPGWPQWVHQQPDTDRHRLEPRRRVS